MDENEFKTKLYADCRKKPLADGARRSKKDINGLVNPHVDGVSERLFTGTRVVTGYHAVQSDSHTKIE